MRTLIGVGLFCIVLTGCSDREIAKGDKGERGPPGPPGPSGTIIRMTELDCKAECAFTCGPEGVILMLTSSEHPQADWFLKAVIGWFFAAE